MKEEILPSRVQYYIHMEGDDDDSDDLFLNNSVNSELTEETWPIWENMQLDDEDEEEEIDDVNVSESDNELM